MASRIKSTYVNIEGIAEWAKVFESNRDLEGYRGAWKDTDGRTTINIILPDDQFQILKDAGSLKKGKPDPDGRGINVKLDRKWNTGRDWDSGQPEIFRADGSVWDLETDGYIGNGSKVLLRVCVTYLPDQDTHSTRLDRIKVIDHVPYERNDPFTQDMTGGSPGHSPSTEGWEHLEDEIPF